MSYNQGNYLNSWGLFERYQITEFVLVPNDEGVANAHHSLVLET